jgi:long-chain fatty acid transport protein
MKKIKLHRLSGMTCALALTPICSFALNGAQPGGYGIKNAAMGGVGIALPLDSLAAANNPAGIAFVPASTTFNLFVFRGESAAQYILPGNSLSNQQTTPAPEGGLVWHLNPQWSFGVSLTGAGSGADYKQPSLPVQGARNALSSLQVPEIAPTVAWKPSSDLAIGLGLNLAYQKFKVDGVIVNAPVPGGLATLPAHGNQSATGVGLRVGAHWKATPDIALGFDYKTKTKMGKLKGYDQDLLAFSEGRIDIPSQWGVGVAWKATPQLTVAADWLQINWGDLKVMQDPNGFQWKNQPVFRVGASWLLNPSWTLRAGYSRNKQQVDSSRVVQNLLVPAINDSAISAGFSWRINPKGEINFAYEFNPKVTLTGTGGSAGSTLSSKVQVIRIGYQHDF